MMIDRFEPRTRSRLLGVCAEAADATGLPPALVRVAGLVALLCAFKLTVVAYCLAALVLRQQRF